MSLCTSSANASAMSSVVILERAKKINGKERKAIDELERVRNVDLMNKDLADTVRNLVGKVKKDDPFFAFYNEWLPDPLYAHMPETILSAYGEFVPNGAIG